MEVWQARAEDGRLREVKILRGLAQKRALSDKEIERISRLKHLKHPRLAPIDNVYVDTGRVVVVSIWPDSTLQERFRHVVTQGKQGIDRREMLQYVMIVAEALDYLQRQEQLFHLSLTPSCMHYYGGRLRVADYGLAQLAWIPAGQTLSPQVLRYAAPELYEGSYHQNSDQFSLALLFAEGVTGRLPFHGNTMKHWREQRRNHEYDLHLLPGHEVEILKRALDFEPGRRFNTLNDFVEELAHAATAKSAGPRNTAAPVPRDMGEPSIILTGQALPVIPPEEVEAIVNRLLLMLAVKTVINKDQGIRFLVEADGTVVHRCAAWLPGGLARQKLEGFASEWSAIPISFDRDEHEYVYHIPMRQSFWQRMLGMKREIIEIRVKLDTPKESHIKQSEVEVRIRYTDSKPTNERERLEIVVPALLYSIRTFLLAKSETRLNERYPFEGKVYLYPVYVDNLGSPMICEGRDISSTGIGLLSPDTFPTTQCIIQLQTEEFGTVILPGKIQRTTPLSKGSFELGIKYFDHLA